ncbi:hypothetical protein [Marinirhabdus gelatinilytica]|uniref:Uncharacterized protein n=1 Tax=Marinirhabdus gelatinilytica TaxID=1703343 RepID=A0A370Q8Q2_9FLAO|nr:hypothetical protein [Marinirhabdus gelatinilytica]RDK84751.1 hypothetical protein C8D94_104124 [Marinirhabdus gelatinilytica]
MHEKLKSQIVLDCNASGAPLNNEYQTLAGRSAYGTFYMLYLKLNGYTAKPPKDPKEHEYSFEIYLQNFEGAITMGFPSQQKVTLKKADKTKYSNESPKHQPDYVLTIEVQPFNTNTTLNISKKLLDESLKGKIIDVDIQHKFPPNMIYDSNNPHNTPYLDPYKYVRDGEDVHLLEYTLVPNPDEKNVASNNKKDSLKLLGKEQKKVLEEIDSKYPDLNILDKFSNHIKNKSSQKDDGDGYGRPFTTQCYPKRVRVV